MPATRLIDHSYGKTRVRLTKVARTGSRHDLLEFCVDVTLRGDFDECYTRGDNSKVVATDSMKNTVYVVAKDHAFDTPERFGLILARHFVERYGQVSGSRIDISSTPWNRIVTVGKPHPHAFVGGGSHANTCVIDLDRKRPNAPLIESGVRDLPILKTTDSAFRGYVMDEFTTLKETDDRIFATNLTASWDYASDDADFAATNALVIQRALDVFAEHKSLAVQQTLYAMGEAALDACGGAIKRIRLRMPNKHRILFYLAPFNRENANEIFVTTDEPSGNIYAELERA
jgi:urate oxidase